MEKIKDELIQEIYEISDGLVLNGMSNLEEYVECEFTLELYSVAGNHRCELNNRLFERRFSRLYDVSNSMIIFDVVYHKGKKVIPCIYKYDSRGLCLLLNAENPEDGEISVTRVKRIFCENSVYEENLDIEFDVFTSTRYDVNLNIN